MLIQCPQCDTTQSVGQDAVPAEGIDIKCRQCGLSFAVRAHPSRTEEVQTSTTSPGPGPADDPDRQLTNESAAPSEIPLSVSAGLHLEAFLQKEEIPYPIVQAYNHPAPEYSHFAVREEQDVQTPGPGVRMIDDYSISLHERESASGPARDEGWSVSPVPLEPRTSPRKRAKSGRLRLVLTLLLVLGALLVLSAISFKLVRENPLGLIKNFVGKVVSSLPFGQEDTGSIQFSELNSHFVSAGKGQTPAFVIQGKVTNNHPVPCQFVQVKGILFDAKGERAAEAVVYCGNVLKKQDIQVLTPERIQEILQNPTGSALSNLNIEPGKSIPFMLVFFNPPENVSEFSVEIFRYQKEKEPEAEKPAPDPQKRSQEG